mgnify:FL=1
MAPKTEPMPWHSLQAKVSDTFAQARWETLNLVQWLARIANSYVEGRTPEDRVLLAFRAADAAFVTKTFAGFALELRLPILQMQFLDDGRPTPHILDPEEHSPAEVEAYLLIELLHRGIDRSKFSKKLPYNIPDLMSGDEDDHSPQACMAGLTQLTAWFQNAVAVLEATARAAGAGKVEIVCWPQTLTLTCVSDAGPTGFGFSPGDTQSPAPFFYRNARSANGSANSNGRTILTASKLLAERDPAAAAAAFMSESK